MSKNQTHLDDLARSGLSAEDAKLLKIQFLPPEKTYALIGKNIESYKIPYFDLNRKPTAFYRVRFLNNPNTGFAITAKKQRKYSQPKNSSPHIYFPPFVNWSQIAQSASTELYIVEGEKKAARLCKEGLPTLGLGGVYSFSNKKQGQFLIPDFDLIKLEKRRVNIVFDSDIDTNEDVLRASILLAKRLVDRGAEPYIIKLIRKPNGDATHKIGVDDFLELYGIAAFKKIKPEIFIEYEALYTFNLTWALILDTASFYSAQTKALYSKHQFQILSADIKHIDINTGSPTLTSKAWLEWSHKKKYSGVDYCPGELIVTKNNCINLWRPANIKPKKSKQSKLKLFHKLVDTIVSDCPEHKTFLLQALGYPIKYPGTKLAFCIVVSGRNEGTGKSLLGLIIAAQYGRNGREVSHEMVFGSDFNPWAMSQFCVADELVGVGYEKKREANRLKNYITSKEIYINEKGKAGFYIKNSINIYATSNEPNALHAETTNRRLFVLTTNAVPMDPSEGGALYDWFTCKEGIAELNYYFTKQLSYDKFNPNARPPVTQAMLDMVEISRNDFETFVLDLEADPDLVYKEIWGQAAQCPDLLTSADIKNLFYSRHNIIQRGNIDTTLGLALSKTNIKRRHCRARRLYIIKNREKWLRESISALLKYYDSSKNIKTAQKTTNNGLKLIV